MGAIPQKNAPFSEDWRLPLTLKFFTTLNEPHKSYFLTSALYSPQKNLIAPTFETTAQAAAKNGPYGAKKHSKNENNDNIMADIVADVDDQQIDRNKTSKKSKKEKKKKKKGK